MVKIGNIELKNQIVAAPLAGISNPVYREIMHDYGAGLVVSEMISDKALHYQNAKTQDMCRISEGEHPVALQLFGCDPVTMAEAAEYLTKNTNCDMIDINMGCPVPKVVRNGEGSALMENLPLVEKIISSMVHAVKIPVTVKCRLGFTDQHINVIDFVKCVEASGASAVVVHGRTREQYYRGKANWNWIRRAKEAVKIPLFGNGDIFTEEDARAMLLATRVDGISLGRGIQGNPFLIRRIRSFLENGVKEAPVSLQERKEMMLRHLRLMEKIKGPHLTLLEMRKHLSWYMEGLPDAASWRNKVNMEKELQEVYKMVERL